jgi:ribokinase
MKILTVSSANMDLVLTTEKVPLGGETFISREGYQYVPGGKGANSALAFARLGGDSVFCTSVGNDPNGDALVSLYDRSGINTEYIERSTVAPTGLAAIILEKECAQNRIIVYPGANMLISDSRIDEAIDSKPDAVFMQFEIATDAILYTAKKAAEKNIPIFFDAGPANPSFPYEKLPRLALFSPNETECDILTGVSPTDEASCMKAAKVLLSKMDDEYIVLKLGGNGCYVYKNGEEKGKHCPSYPIEKVDTTAAGDAFTAGLTLEYLACGDMVRAAKYANAVGAITVSRMGASSSIPERGEVEAFIAERGIDIG